MLLWCHPSAGTIYLAIVQWFKLLVVNIQFNICRLCATRNLITNSVSCRCILLKYWLTFFAVNKWKEHNPGFWNPSCENGFFYALQLCLCISSIWLQALASIKCSQRNTSEVIHCSNICLLVNTEQLKVYWMTCHDMWADLPKLVTSFQFLSRLGLSNIHIWEHLYAFLCMFPTSIHFFYNFCSFGDKENGRWINISKFVHPVINSSLLNMYDVKHLLFKCSFYPAQV
jgi:hypothetical protein